MLRLVLLFSLFCSAAFAQVTPGTSPLSGAKGGTNNAFMQFSGPASSLKTYTLPNASSTLAALAQIQTWTGAQSFTDGKLVLLGVTSGSSILKAPATGGGTATLFAGSDTIAGLAAAQTFTNKTINGASNTLTVRLASDVTGTLPLASIAAGTQDTILGYFGSTALSAIAPGNCLNALTYNTSTHAFGCNTTAGTGTVTQVICGTGLSGGTITATGTCALALTNATLQVGPLAPTGVASNLMLGMGSACHLAPVYSTRMLVTFTGSITNGGAGVFTNMALRFGTSTAPANGAVPSGTVVSGPLSVASSANFTPFSLTAIITGLTASTAYWLDLSASPATGTSSFSGVNCTAVEL